MKHDTKQIGLRIRTARKQKGMNQTQLAAALGKSLRTIQKYESGEIEVSLAMINELAGVLDTTSTYLTGYDTQEKPLTNMADVMQFLFQLDQIRELGFRIDVKRPPEHDRWECSITFNGKDLSSSGRIQGKQRGICCIWPFCQFLSGLERQDTGLLCSCPVIRNGNGRTDRGRAHQPPERLFKGAVQIISPSKERSND